MAPEYVMHGHLSVKADVFSFGVLVLELISGQRNSNFNLNVDAQNLLDWVRSNSNTALFSCTLLMFSVCFEKTLCLTFDKVICFLVSPFCHVSKLTSPNS